MNNQPKNFNEFVVALNKAKKMFEAELKQRAFWKVTKKENTGRVVEMVVCLN